MTATTAVCDHCQRTFPARATVDVQGEAWCPDCAGTLQVARLPPESPSGVPAARPVVVTDIRLSFGAVFALVVKVFAASALLGAVVGFVWMVLARLR